MREVGAVAALRRYPVKSMLGEDVASVSVSSAGVAGDRAFALVDADTGRIASAKQPRLWRDLLQCRATWGGNTVTITLPGGRTVADADADAELSKLLQRKVRLAHARPEHATIARPDPEDVIEHGAEADVAYREIEIGGGVDGTSFVDYAPVSVITTATLAHVGQDAIRYRPNVVVATGPGEAPFTENDWAGIEIRIGDVRLRGIIPTPRCAIPTLAHGALPRDVEAVRALLTMNRLDVAGAGPAPCAGVYAEVIEPGTIHPGDTVTIG